MHRGYLNSAGLFTRKLDPESSTKAVEDHTAELRKSPCRRDDPGASRRAVRPVLKLALCCREMEPALAAITHRGDASAEGIDEVKRPSFWTRNSRREERVLYDSDAYDSIGGVGGQTPLMLAAEHGDTETVQRFINHGAFIDLPERLPTTDHKLRMGSPALA
ncbi:hypothetical protein BDV98DRAFT_287910 [Pterulicium gracile]|uniref:Uncharacterized protein n=1 Tax=Pterulicium gracile TaxID=1884261 RepID=A0A5C3QT54_9AGAR|nr:hypothetical protein BDV98DRAFT_287910 [Pterula gracilis]